MFMYKFKGFEKLRFLELGTLLDEIWVLYFFPQLHPTLLPLVAKIIQGMLRGILSE